MQKIIIKSEHLIHFINNPIKPHINDYPNSSRQINWGWHASETAPVIAGFEVDL